MGLEGIEGREKKLERAGVIRQHGDNSLLLCIDQIPDPKNPEA